VEIDADRALRISKATRHPLKIAALRRLEEVGRTSPNELADHFEVSLGVVAYHIKDLARLRAIQQVDVVPVRGAAEHFYSLADFGKTVLLTARFATAPWPQPDEEEQ
jgi:DNA-binding transcriptional ArsR family regulator